jgi:uncharacterized protein (TIGR00251 family)
MPGAKGPGVGDFDPWRGALAVRVSAPAQGGAANAELCQRLAGALGLPTSRVALASGARSREKTVRIEGLSPEEVRRRLEANR